MKIFSAQGPGHKEFSLIEFNSELEALPLINELPNNVNIIDMFSLFNGRFVAMISCNDLKKIYDSLRSHPSALDGYFTNDTNMQSLQAFYYLNKPEISDSLMILETEKMTKLFEVLDHANRSEVQILDIKNQRSFKTNTIYLTANFQKLSALKEKLNNSSLKIQLIENVSDSLKKAFGH